MSAKLIATVQLGQTYRVIELDDQIEGPNLVVETLTRDALGGEKWEPATDRDLRNVLVEMALERDTVTRPGSVGPVEEDPYPAHSKAMRVCREYGIPKILDVCPARIWWDPDTLDARVELEAKEFHELLSRPGLEHAESELVVDDFQTCWNDGSTRILFKVRTDALAAYRATLETP